MLKQRKLKKGAYPEWVERKEVKIMTKFKGKCESDYLLESKRLYNKFMDAEKLAKAEVVATDVLDGTKHEKSSSAKQRVAEEAAKKISMRRADFKAALGDLEKGFADYVYDFADLPGAGLSRQLVQSLNSGINYTQNELLYMAKMSENDEADSRLLHDYAKTHGFELNNYRSPEDKIKSFHEMNARLRISADDENNAAFMRLSDAGVDALVNKYWKEVVSIPAEEMTVAPVAKSIDEEIQRDLNKRKAEKMKEADANGEFLKGFGVEPQETDPEYYEPEEVTEEERERVREISEKMGYEPSKKE